MIFNFGCCMRLNRKRFILSKLSEYKWLEVGTCVLVIVLISPMVDWLDIFWKLSCIDVVLSIVVANDDVEEKEESSVSSRSDGLLCMTNLPWYMSPPWGVIGRDVKYPGKINIGQVVFGGDVPKYLKRNNLKYWISIYI